MFWNTFYKICESKHTKPNAVAKIIGVSSATCTKWKNGTVPNGDTLLKLADYLNCSVDYLLGRTDEPQGITQINTGDVGNNSSVNINKNNSDDELVSLISSLSLLDRSKVVLFIDELKQNEKES